MWLQRFPIRVISHLCFQASFCVCVSVLCTAFRGGAVPDGPANRQLAGGWVAAAGGLAAAGGRASGGRGAGGRAAGGRVGEMSGCGVSGGGSTRLPEEARDSAKLPTCVVGGVSVLAAPVPPSGACAPGTPRAAAGARRIAQFQMTLAGLEPAIFGSEDQCLIH